jgi:hypothetical protein
MYIATYSRVDTTYIIIFYYLLLISSGVWCPGVGCRCLRLCSISILILFSLRYTGAAPSQCHTLAPGHNRNKEIEMNNKPEAEAVVYLTRHGARIDSDDSDWLNKCNHNRSNDPHLSQGGNIGAQELAQRLKGLLGESHCENQIKHIISSPYIRCVETANTIAQVLNVPIKIEPGIAEVNSSRQPQFLDTDQLQQQFPLIDSTYKPVMMREDLPLEYSDGACATRSANTARKELGQSCLLDMGHHV